ncbi:hypothetical protein [Saccharothrix lopnurensis]|uniref:Uncharacterized protein n=1 Tax=Saccharothrix lopnurensis TaxID=1670621 RepID=A0ABW1P8N5_9PSEU
MVVGRGAVVPWSVGAGCSGSAAGRSRGTAAVPGVVLPVVVDLRGVLLV